MLTLPGCLICRDFLFQESKTVVTYSDDDDSEDDHDAYLVKMKAEGKVRTDVGGGDDDEDDEDESGINSSCVLNLGACTLNMRASALDLGACALNMIASVLDLICT